MAVSADPTVLVRQARAGDRRSLARLISIVENNGTGANQILADAFSAGGTGWTTGITGAPGAGKSTLTDRFVAHTRQAGPRVAVVAVDPSSPFSGGAVLGDRVRMQDHIDDHGVYIRSMASRGRLGGIAAATPKVVAVLDGVGFPEVVIETVGVGQAEVEIAGNTDTTVVVVNPGWGDSVQAAKAGLLEIGDVFVVNKADRPGVNETIRDLTQMLELGIDRAWTPPILPVTASVGEGIGSLIEAVAAHRGHLESTGELANNRRARMVAEMESALMSGLRRAVRASVVDEEWAAITKRVGDRVTDPWSAAAQLLSSQGVASE